MLTLNKVIKMIDYRLFFLAIVSTILCSSCKNDPLDVDVSNLEIKINFVNADSMLFYSTNSRRILVNRNFKQSFSDLYLFTFEKGLKIRTTVDRRYARAAGRCDRRPRRVRPRRRSSARRTRRAPRPARRCRRARAGCRDR